MHVVGDTKVACRICTLEFVPDNGARKHCEVCRHLPGDLHKTVNQLRKAFKIAQAMIARGGSPVDCMHGPAVMRRSVEELAEVDKSSDETWALAAVLMSGKPA